MRGLRWWFSTGGGEATRPPRLGDPSRPRLGSEVGETEADGGWTTQRKRLCAHVVLPLWHLLHACGCSVLLHVTLTPPPEASWVMMRQAPGLWDASEGGAERGPLWRGSGELAGTVVGPGGCMQHRGCLKNSERHPHVLLPGVRSRSVAATQPSHPRAARHLV